jgi:hypothetical protein
MSIRAHLKSATILTSATAVVFNTARGPFSKLSVTGPIWHACGHGRKSIYNNGSMINPSASRPLFPALFHRHNQSSPPPSLTVVGGKRTDCRGQYRSQRSDETRKQRLAKLLKGASSNIPLNEHFDGDGEIVFEQACNLGCEGIVSKRLGSLYRSGRSKNWLKVKNPAAPAVRREAEEEWR